ncbi:bacteriophage abortive infection AbiH family protein [Paenibacillus sp. Leaf72]|uniref:bacteriophage abortive infection AbiH family protein n=1 Tax=Paenibacillus sp. Leaf72 TaxID=1736234 RepID=UPI0006F23F27|nr:bacteriophage abortive infection AbiH family protein [Paenibacillus sp. Leaf72]KQN96787.1 hypothetical protein ASF12_22200 [Paenibacillus sp. Leaf72]
MKLFIIGNGFDRGHGLPTTYSQFRTYLEEKHWEFLMSFEETYSIYQPDLSDPYYQKEKHTKSVGEMFWNDLETNLANIDSDRIIEDAVHMNLGLENEYDILDTLEQHHAIEYQYIKELALYLLEWAKTINLDNARPRTTLINPDNEAIYITFNYTEVLENVYQIDPYEVIHIHGSIREGDIAPVLGHGNRGKIDRMREDCDEAEGSQHEKAMSILRTLINYLTETYKDISEYMHELSSLRGKEIEEIIVIGHSLSGVDIPYFKEIDLKTSKKANWKVYYHGPGEEKKMLDSMIDCEIDKERIVMIQSSEFYDLL